VNGHAEIVDIFLSKAYYQESYILIIRLVVWSL
jgi:hypothetical protein